MKTLYSTLYLLLLFLPGSLAQNPTHYPTPGTEPVEFSPGRIIVYLIIPILLVGVVWWQARKRRQRNKKGSQSGL